PEVVAVDTESRGRPAAEARQLARSAFAHLAHAGPALVYKKVDSTLRGALAAELAGALEGADRGRAVLLTPALPAPRRTVVAGLLRVDGRPAGQSPVAADPGFPPTGASVPALLGVEGPRPAVVVPLVAVQRGVDAVRRCTERFDAAFACDAETDADLAIL